jgi:hypothetical protein
MAPRYRLPAAGALLLREIDRLGKIFDMFSRGFVDYRAPRFAEHSARELITQRTLGICLGYEDLDDHDELRHDPLDRGRPRAQARMSVRRIHVSFRLRLSLPADLLTGSGQPGGGASSALLRCDEINRCIDTGGAVPGMSPTLLDHHSPSKGYGKSGPGPPGHPADHHNSTGCHLSSSMEPATSVNRGLRKALRDNLSSYAFLAPWLLGFFILTLYPMIYSLYLSFTKFDILQPPQWAGLRNYVIMFVGNARYPRDTRFLNSLFVALRFVFISVPLKLVFALAVAMLMNQRLRLIPFYRTLYYIPTLLGGSVAIAVLWRRKCSAMTGVLPRPPRPALRDWPTRATRRCWSTCLSRGLIRPRRLPIYRTTPS